MFFCEGQINALWIQSAASESRMAVSLYKRHYRDEMQYGLAGWHRKGCFRTEDSYVKDSITVLDASWLAVSCRNAFIIFGIATQRSAVRIELILERKNRKPIHGAYT